MTLGDGKSQLRRRVSRTGAGFTQVSAALDNELFLNELRIAAVPTAEWRSSGSWIRIERAGTVALTKPPVEAPHIRAVLTDINILFEKTFGERYQPVPLD
ncbi:MAG TPA: hypothetical protein VEK79_06255 [Thermoanaerobaculia bacterium]|nr:hypothetical protein [Thermoanaerobaculia bacterium]